MPNPYFRLTEQLPRRVDEKRYRALRAKIGYVCVSDGYQHIRAYFVSDSTCRDGELLRIPPISMREAYECDFRHHVTDESTVRLCAVYFDPYLGQYLIVGDREIYDAAHDVLGYSPSSVYLEDENPLTFNPKTYGAYTDPDSALFTYEDYFTPDITGKSAADCMTDNEWDNEHGREIALRFFDRYGDILFDIKKDTGSKVPDHATWILSRILLHGNCELLSTLCIMYPAVLSRFSMHLDESERFSQSTDAPFPCVTPPEGAEHLPKLFNLVQYAILFADCDTLQVLFQSFRSRMDTEAYLRQTRYASSVLWRICENDTDILSLLLAWGLSPDCQDTGKWRLSLLSASVIAHHPAQTALLVAHGADVLKLDGMGKTAFDYALEENTPSCLIPLLHGLTDENRTEVLSALAEKVPLGDGMEELASVLRGAMSN